MSFNIWKIWKKLKLSSQNNSKLWLPKKRLQNAKKCSTGFTYESWILNVKLNSTKFFYDPWIVKIDIVNLSCKNNFCEIFSHKFFSLVTNRVHDPLMDNEIPNSIFNRPFPNSHRVTSSKNQNNILKTVSSL